MAKAQKSERMKTATGRKARVRVPSVDGELDHGKALGLVRPHLFARYFVDSITEADEPAILEWARAGLSGSMIAARLRVRRSTFQHWLDGNPDLREAIEAAREDGLGDILEAQRLLGLRDLSAPMLVHLGKATLGQNDKSTVTVDASVGLFKALMALPED